MKRICYLMFRLLFLLDGGWSLRNLSISVPRAVLAGVGQAATFRCNYDLDGAALYSIRWYRAHTEFYRYVPRELPPHMVFPLPGATVDLTESDSHQVRVLGLTRRLSGEYQCEVSADAPLFHTVILKTNLTVVDPPFRAPQMHIDRETYTRGDVITANCTVDDSYPPPNITWLIDGQKVGETISPAPAEGDFKERGAFSHIRLTVLDTDLPYTTDYLNYNTHQETRVVSHSVSAPVSGVLSLRCVGVIFDVFARQSEVTTLREDKPRPASVTGEDNSADALLSRALFAASCASLVVSLL